MKKTLAALLMGVALCVPSFARSGSHGSGHKSHARGSNDGTYAGGKGSSHKGGHYKNKKTNDDYRDRKGGTPK